MEGSVGALTGLGGLAGLRPPAINGNPTMRRRASADPVSRGLSSVGAFNAASDCGATLPLASPSKSTNSDGTRESNPSLSSSNLRNVSKIWLMLSQFKGYRCARLQSLAMPSRQALDKNDLRRSGDMGGVLVYLNRSTRQGNCQQERLLGDAPKSFGSTSAAGAGRLDRATCSDNRPHQSGKNATTQEIDHIPIRSTPGIRKLPPTRRDCH